MYIYISRAARWKVMAEQQIHVESEENVCRCTYDYETGHELQHMITQVHLLTYVRMRIGEREIVIEKEEACYRGERLRRALSSVRASRMASPVERESRPELARPNAPAHPPPPPPPLASPPSSSPLTSSARSSREALAVGVPEAVGAPSYGCDESAMSPPATFSAGGARLTR